MTKTVFVYGTLKEKFGGNYILSEAKKLGVAETYKKYSITGSGFPRAVDETSPYYKEDISGYVIGEAYEVTDEMSQKPICDRACLLRYVQSVVTFVGSQLNN